METNKILSANLLDILFDDRNKDYGAYELRKTYPKQITKALFVTGIITLLVFGSLLARSSKQKNNNTVVLKSYDLTSIKDDKDPDLPKPKRQMEQPQVRTEQLTRIEIKSDDQVKQLPPTQDDLKIADIDIKKQDGVEPDGLSNSNNIDDGKDVIEKKQHDESNEPWSGPVEIEAKFTGNWKTFLERNLNPNVPVDNSAPAGN